MHVSGTREQRIADIARRQRGFVSRRQLHAAAVSRGAISRMVARGSLEPALPGVYAVGHHAAVPLGRETAALLACPAGAVLSHHSAAAVWGLRPLRGGPVDVLLAGRAGKRPGVRIHRTRTLDRQDVRIRDGLPVTSPARTLLDLADDLKTRALERALDEALDTNLVRLSHLHETLGRANGRHGAAVLGALLGRGHTTRTRSGYEERFHALIREARLPEPLVNVPRHGYLIDFLWPEHGVAVEIDTYSFHGGPKAFERDRRKSAVLTAAGLAVLRITGEQLDDEPLTAVATVAQTLALGATRTPRAG